MWVREVRHTTTATPAAIWKRWTDITDWPEQDTAMKTVELQGPLALGSTIVMHQKQGGTAKSVITVLDPKTHTFTSESKLPAGYLRFEHEIVTAKSGHTEFLHRVTIKGPLTFLLRKLFAEKMVAELPQMLANIARLAEQAK